MTSINGDPSNVTEPETPLDPGPVPPSDAHGSRRRARPRSNLERALLWTTVIVGFALLIAAGFVIWTALERQQQPQTALERELAMYEAAVASNPKSPDAHADYGAALYEAGRQAEGVEQMEIAVKIQPNHYNALYNLAVIHWEQGKRDKAIKELKNLAARGPGRNETWFKLGTFQQELEKWKDAIESYEMVLKITTGDVAARFRIGVCYEALGDTDKAIEMYESTLMFVPDYEPSTKALERLGER